LEFAPVFARFRDATEAAVAIVPEAREFNESLGMIATEVSKAIDGLLCELDSRIEAARAGHAAPELRQSLTRSPELPQISDRIYRPLLKLTKEEAKDRTAA
jgi:hypothetical protein